VESVYFILTGKEMRNSKERICDARNYNFNWQYAFCYTISNIICDLAFYRYIDVVLLFSSAIGISLIMNAIFLPISYFDSNDRTEAMSIISLIISVALMVGLIAVINILIEKPTDMQLMIFATGNLVLAIAVFLISCSLTVSIYSKQDC